MIQELESLILPFIKKKRIRNINLYRKALVHKSIFKIVNSIQNNREKGPNVLHAENSVNSIHSKLVKALKMKKQVLSVGSIYGNGNAGNKIVKYLETIKIDQTLIEKQISY